MSYGIHRLVWHIIACYGKHVSVSYAHNRLLWRTHIHLLSHKTALTTYIAFHDKHTRLSWHKASYDKQIAFYGNHISLIQQKASYAQTRLPRHLSASRGTYSSLAATIPSPIITKAPVAVHICLLWHIFGFHSLHYLPLQICYFFVGRLHHQVIQNSYIIDHLVMAKHDPIVEYTSTIFPTMEGSKRFPILAHINMLPI